MIVILHKRIEHPKSVADRPRLIHALYPTNMNCTGDNYGASYLENMDWRPSEPLVAILCISELKHHPLSLTTS